jgi:hypothetical protein
VLVLVIDRSSSMSTRMANANAGATYFVDNFAAGRDRLGLVVFGGSAIIAYPWQDWGKDVRTAALNGPDVNFKNTGDSDAQPNMLRSIGHINSKSNTGTAEALILAYKELAAANQPGALNVIVLFTDGQPNGISAYFNDYNGGYVKNAVNPAPANVGGSTCSWAKDPQPTMPQVIPMHPMLGWIAQGGGFVSGGAQDGHGVFTLMQTDQTTYTTVTDWLVAASTTNRYPGGTSGETILPAPPAPLATAASPTAGCKFSQYNTTTKKPASDVVSSDVVIPSKDLYGNSTLGIASAPYTLLDYQQSEIWNNECNNGSRIAALNTAALVKSNDACVVGLASWNAADMAARYIRTDPSGVKPVIYSMGYTGTAGVDEVLMKRIANVQSSTAPSTVHNTVYNAGSKEGLYIQINNDDDVAPAYRRILAEVLRLSM